MNQALNFSPSPYADFMQQSKVNLGNGIDIHFEMGGPADAPVILLIMGLGAQMLHWPDFFCKTLIDQGFRVLRFDNRDSGLSSKIKHQGTRLNPIKLMGRFSLGLDNHGAPYDLYDMADDIARLIERLNLPQVYVIGASMGGMITQILAARHPDKVKKIALLFTSNNQPLLPPPFPKQFISLFERPKKQDQETIVNHSVKLFNIIGSPGYVNQLEAIQTARKLYQRSYYPTGVMQQFFAILCTGSLLQINKQIKQPTLVVHGSKDRLLPPRHGKAVAKAITGAKFELIEGLGHDLPPHFIPLLSSLFIHHFQS